MSSSRSISHGLPLVCVNGEPPAFATDAREQIVYWNRAAERLVGVLEEDALGFLASAVLSEDELQSSVRMQLPDVAVYLLHVAAPSNQRSSVPAAVRGCPLSGRQREILGLASNGYASINIAARLNLSKATVRNHIQNVLRKLDVHGQVEAVAVALRHGWIGTQITSPATVAPPFPAPSVWFQSLSDASRGPQRAVRKAIAA